MQAAQHHALALSYKLLSVLGTRACMLAWSVTQAGDGALEPEEAHHKELVEAALVRQRSAHHLQVAHHLRHRPHQGLGFLTATATLCACTHAHASNCLPNVSSIRPMWQTCRTLPATSLCHAGILVTARCQGAGGGGRKGPSWASWRARKRRGRRSARRCRGWGRRR